MSKKSEINVLQNLLNIYSPSGFERPIADYLKKELTQYLPEKDIKIDYHNNVIASIKGKSDKTIMIDAHLDQIGFMVTNINKRGLLSLDMIGGGDTSILSAKNLVILTENGEVNAVVDRLHAHLVKDEDEVMIESFEEAIVDIGASNMKEAKKAVKIGDPIVYKAVFEKLLGENYAGCGFDDKSGCFIMLEAIKNIVKSKKKPEYNLVFTFSSQEEIGGQKTRNLALDYKPDLYIEIDVTFASDYIENLEDQTGLCRLGDGPVLYRGVNIDNKALAFMEKTAEKYKLDFQRQASTGNSGYTTQIISRYGIRTLVMGVPLRNMHSPLEVINYKDLVTNYKLLVNFLLEVKSKNL